MRLFALLFALYLACLSCLPCADDVPGSVGPAQARISAAAHSDGGHRALGDWCSPLCQCHCCAGAVLAPTAAPALVFAQPARWATGPRHAALQVPTPTRVAGVVWQPPRA